MFGKVTVQDTKRSIKDYLIYLITVTIAFSLIFAFNLVASSEEDNRIIDRHGYV